MNLIILFDLFFAVIEKVTLAYPEWTSSAVLMEDLQNSGLDLKRLLRILIVWIHQSLLDTLFLRLKKKYKHYS